MSEENRYPQKQDLKKHTEQFVNGLRQYFLLNGNIEITKNDLRTLFTDLVLEHHNNKTHMYGEMNFNKFLKLLITKKDVNKIMRESKTYREILKHRENCPKWQKEFCLECFGGGLTKFTKKMLEESR